MGFLTWFFGNKKEQAAEPARPVEKELEPVRAARPAPPPAPNSAAQPERPAPAPAPKPAPPSEADNLRRWRESGQPRAWVESRQGQWDHAAWLALLDELKSSPFWPMHPEEVGATLEDARREWLNRN